MCACSIAGAGVGVGAGAAQRRRPCCRRSAVAMQLGHAGEFTDTCARLAASSACRPLRCMHPSVQECRGVHASKCGSAQRGACVLVWKCAEGCMRPSVKVCRGVRAYKCAEGCVRAHPFAPAGRLAPGAFHRGWTAAPSRVWSAWHKHRHGLRMRGHGSAPL